MKYVLTILLTFLFALTAWVQAPDAISSDYQPRVDQQAPESDALYLPRLLKVSDGSPIATTSPTETSPVTGTPTVTATPTSSASVTPIPTGTATQISMPTAIGTTTSTPTVTPTPSPTATLIDEITVLDNHRAYINSIDYLHIVGEVRNNTGERARFVKITANLFNAQNQLVDTDYTYASLDVLPAGGAACFDMVFLSAPAYDYYTFETSYSATTETSLLITVFGDSGSYHPTFEDWYEVVGQARNDSSVNAEYVKVIGTLYQDNGQVLDCDYTYTNADVLTPGQVSTWKITFLDATNGLVGSYRLQAQGREE